MLNYPEEHPDHVFTRKIEETTKNQKEYSSISDPQMAALKLAQLSYQKHQLKEEQPSNQLQDLLLPQTQGTAINPQQPQVLLQQGSNTNNNDLLNKTTNSSSNSTEPNQIVNTKRKRNDTSEAHMTDPSPLPPPPPPLPNEKVGTNGVDNTKEAPQGKKANTSKSVDYLSV
jgi:hypothetical protein